MSENSKLLELLAAATELVRDWDEHPCPRCGGTGVAYDWPAAMALRDAIQDQPYVGGHPEMPLHPYVPTGEGECQNFVDIEVAKLAATLINEADIRGARDFDVSEALARAERLRSGRCP